MKMFDYRIVLIASLWIFGGLTLNEIKVVITDIPNVVHATVCLFFVNGTNLYYSPNFRPLDAKRVLLVRVPETLPSPYQIYAMLLLKDNTFCNSSFVMMDNEDDWHKAGTVEINFGNHCVSTFEFIEENVGVQLQLICPPPDIKLPAIINFSWYYHFHSYSDSLLYMSISSLEESTLFIKTTKWDDNAVHKCYGKIKVKSAFVEVFFRRYVIRIKSHSNFRIHSISTRQERNLCRGDELYNRSVGVQRINAVEYNGTNYEWYSAQVCLYYVKNNHSLYRYTKTIGPVEKTGDKQYGSTLRQLGATVTPLPSYESNIGQHGPTIRPFKNTTGHYGTTVTPYESTIGQNGTTIRPYKSTIKQYGTKTIPNMTSVAYKIPTETSHQNVFFIVAGVSVLIVITFIILYIIIWRRYLRKKKNLPEHQNENLIAEYEMPVALVPDTDNYQIPEVPTTQEEPCYDYAYISQNCHTRSDHVYDYAYGHWN